MRRTSAAFASGQQLCQTTRASLPSQAVAAERTAAERTHVAALAPIRVPLEVAPPAFTLVTAGAAAHLEHDGAEVRVPPGALATSGTLSIRPLAAREVAKLPLGLLNTTRGPRRGYRMEPSGHFGARHRHAAL